MEKILKKNKDDSFLFFCVVVLILISSETLYFGTNGNQSIRNFGYILFASLIGLCLWKWLDRCDGIPNSKLFLLLTFFSLICMTMITNMDISIKYGYEFCLLFLAFYVSTELEFKKFKEYFIKVMLFLSIWSLIVFFLVERDANFFAQFPTVSNLAGIKFKNVIFAFVQELELGQFNRNFGIFREPGVYAVFLVIALAFELLNNPSVKIHRVLILCATILTTYSTGGYIVMAGLLFLFLIKGPLSKNVTLKCILICAFIISLFVLDMDSLFNRVFKKLFTENGSRNARFGAITVNIQLILNKPLYMFFGLGFPYVESNFLILGPQMGVYSPDNTNTLFKIFSVHGLFYFLISVYLLFSFTKQLSKNIFERVALFVLFFASLSTEDFIVNEVLYLLMFYSMVFQKREIKE